MPPLLGSFGLAAMSDYHSEMKGIGETTQWEDIQVKLGNYQPREKPKPPHKFEPEKQADKVRQTKRIETKRIDTKGMQTNRIASNRIASRVNL